MFNFPFEHLLIIKNMEKNKTGVINHKEFEFTYDCEEEYVLVFCYICNKKIKVSEQQMKNNYLICEKCSYCSSEELDDDLSEIEEELKNIYINKNVIDEFNPEDSSKDLSIENTTFEGQLKGIKYIYLKKKKIYF